MGSKMNAREARSGRDGAKSQPALDLFLQRLDRRGIGDFDGGRSARLDELLDKLDDLDLFGV